MATVLTNAGKAIVTNRLRSGGTEPLFVSWGTGAGTAAITDTTLFTEANAAGTAIGVGTRTTGTSTQQTTTVTNDTYQVIGTITTSAGFTVTNVGLFDNATGGSGNLFIKSDFTGVVLASGDSIQFTIRASFA